MLSKKSLKIFASILNAGKYFGYSPYSYSPQKHEVVFTNKRRQILRIGLNIIFVLLYEVFLLVRWLKAVVGNETSLGECVKLSYTLFMFLIMNVNHFILFKDYGRHHGFINEFLNFAASPNSAVGKFLHTNSALDENADTENDIWDVSLVLKLCAFGCMFPPFARCIGVLKNPQSKALITSALNSPERQPILARVLLGMMQLNMNCFHTYHMLLNGAIIISYIYTVIPILEKIRSRSANNKNCTLPSLIICRCQMELEILQSHFNATYGIWTFHTEVLGSTIVIVQLFVAVELGNVRSFIVAMSILVLLMIFFKKFAEVFEISSKVVESWRGRVRAKNVDVLRLQLYPKPEIERCWFGKFFKSCQPLKVQVGNFFYADNFLVLTMISIIVYNSTNLILTFNQAK